jgi:hypothetical protein
MTMKKPLLATLGVAGACAACCAIPLAVPMLSGLTTVGLTAFNWDFIPDGARWMAGASVVAAAAWAVAAWWNARKPVTACGVGADAGSCECPKA